VVQYSELTHYHLKQKKVVFLTSKVLQCKFEFKCAAVSMNRGTYAPARGLC
jgi:hypothetical protein